MEMDMECKWSGKWGTICETNRMDWFGFGAECRLKTHMTDIEPSQNMIKVTQKQGYI